MELIKDLGCFTFNALLDNSVRKFGELPALAMVGKTPYTYREVKEKSCDVSRMLSGLSLKPGCKVAVLGTGRPEWGIAYLGIVCHGMIAVPLLPDFSSKEVASIFRHCGVDALVVEKKLFSNLKDIEAELPAVIICMDDYTVIKGPEGCGTSMADYAEVPVPQYDTKEEDTASIIYTSGTTGRSKGVELTHKNLVWTSIQCQYTYEVKSSDRTLSFLPLSHVYEFTVGFLMQFLNGACVYYLGKPPVVSALLPAFKIVKPTIVLSVPLVMEKIYKQKIIPTFTKNGFIKFLYKIPAIRKLLHKIAGKSLMATFGGEVNFFGIGGAMIDPKVERFMKEARFPYAIGYGLTETSPLIASSGPDITVPGTIGVVVPGVDMKINNPNPKTGVGEIVVKGENIMKGYYKDPELTAEAFTTADDTAGAGYFKTGDLGVFVKHHGRPYLILKGRNKNMILGSNGENIYPEDIEFVLNQHPLITESLVVESDDGLVALVKLDEDKMSDTITDTAKKLVSGVVNVVNDREKITADIMKYVNSNVNKISRVVKIQEVINFEKTATQKIKRYLYDLSGGNKKKDQKKDK